MELIAWIVLNVSGAIVVAAAPSATETECRQAVAQAVNFAKLEGTTTVMHSDCVTIQTALKRLNDAQCVVIDTTDTGGVTYMCGVPE